MNKKKIFIVLLQLTLAVILVVCKGWTSGTLRILYQSYFADILLPFGFYFLLSLIGAESKFLDMWWKKALVIFGLCTISEILQYFGIYALATVFDPVDIAMYGLGVLLASFVDRKVFARYFPFW